MRHIYIQCCIKKSYMSEIKDVVFYYDLYYLGFHELEYQKYK